MSEIANQVLESFKNIPVDIQHPILAVGFGVAAGLAAFDLKRNYSKVEEIDGRDFANVNQLEKSIAGNQEEDRKERFGSKMTSYMGAALLALPFISKSKDRGDKDLSEIEQQEKSLAEAQKEHRKDRLRPTMLAYLGVGAVAATFIGGINYETNKVDPSSSVVIVKDVSYSMERTSDLGGTNMTRSQAVDSVLPNLNYEGSLAEVQVANENKLVLPLTHGWSHSKDLTKTASIDLNGGQLAPAIKLAGSLFPATGVGKEIVVISDGTIDDQAKMQAVSNTLKNSGVKIKIIVPGTAAGTYKLKPGANPTSSKVMPESFKAFGGQNITQAQTKEQVSTAIRKAVVDSGKTKHKYPWYPLALIGAGLMGLGTIKNHLQRGNRLI